MPRMRARCNCGTSDKSFGTDCSRLLSTVDDIVAVRASKGSMKPQLSITRPQIIQYKTVKNTIFQQISITCRNWFGTRGSEVRILSPRPINPSAVCFTSMSDSINMDCGRAGFMASPIRSWHFLSAGITGLACIAGIAYILLVHRHAFTANAVCAVILPICVLLVGQWFRTLRYCNQLEDLDAKGTRSGLDQRGVPPKSVLQLAVRGLSDVLFWSYLVNLYMLILIMWLLTRLIGSK